MSDPKNINTVMNFTLSNLGIIDKIKQYQIFEKWQMITGEQIAKIAQPERIYNGKLFVKVLNSTWRNELAFLKPQLLNKIREVLETKNINDIIFR